MSASTLDEILAAIRRLPLGERQRLIERAAQEVEEDTPRIAPARESSSPSLIGLMADDSDLVDQMCEAVYQARVTARMRALDE